MGIAPQGRQDGSSCPEGTGPPRKRGHRQADGSSRRHGRVVRRPNPSQQRYQADDGYDGPVLQDHEPGTETDEPGKGTPT